MGKARVGTLGLLRSVSFLAGSVALAAALLLDPLSLLILSAHMLQHLLLTLVAPPLLIFSRPLLFVRSLLPPGWRRSLAFTRFLAIVRWLRSPILAWCLFSGSFVFWHLPGPYVWALYNSAARAASLASFLLCALSFWAAVMVRGRGRARGTLLVLVTAAAVASSLPGALMCLAPRVLYRGLPDPFPICGLTGLEDQQLAGLLMWIPMDAVLFAAACWLFIGWLRDAEAAAVAGARRMTRLSERQASDVRLIP